MPSYKTHSIHGELVLNDIDKKVEIDRNDIRTFCFGFDTLIFSDYSLFKYQHRNNTKDYFETLLQLIKEKGLQDNSEVMAFIYGQLDHFVLDIVIHLGRLRDNSRRVLEISEVVGMENEEIKLRQLYKFEEVGSFRDIEEVGEKKAVYGGTKSNEQDNKVNGRLRKINDLMNLTKLEFAGLIDIYKEEDF